MRIGMLAALLIAIVVVVCQIPSSAAVEKKKKAAEPPPSYADDIKPLIANYCGDCHSGPKAKGGYSFDSIASMTKAGKKGPAVVPGKPGNSRMILAMGGTKGIKAMPPKDKPQPTGDEARKILAWVQGGAKETNDATDADAKDTAKKDADDSTDEKPAKGKAKPKK